MLLARLHRGDKDKSKTTMPYEEISDVEVDNLNAEIEREHADSELVLDAEEADLFPATLDVERYVAEALIAGVSPFQIADAVLAGFLRAKQDPFKAEQCADQLLDRSYEAQKN